MGYPLSPILVDIYMHYFANTLFEKISFPLWTRYVDDTFTLIDTSVHNVNHLLQIMNSIDNNIQFPYEIENYGVLSFHGTLVPAQTKVSQHQYILNILLFPYIHTLVLATHLVKKWPHFTLLLIAP